MRRLSRAGLLILLLQTCLFAQVQKSTSPQKSSKPAVVKNLVFDFEKDSVGKMAAGFFEAMTGRGKPGVWKVLVDKTAPTPDHVLAQTSSKNFGYHFDMAIAKDTDFSDLTLEVQFKGVRGQEDRGGGPVWRYQDADNYYICRANPLENNFRVYKVVDGNRRMMRTVNLKITSNQWHTIKIENIGGSIKCYYDGKLYLKVKDKTFRHGKIGVWTKADAVTYFDHLKVSAAK